MSSTFKPFTTDDIVRANPTEVTVGLWPGGTGSLYLFYKGSQSGSTSGQYYWNVYNIDPSSSSAVTSFAIAYGNRTGAGHPTLVQDNNSTLATQAVYSQWRQLLLEPGDTKFTFEATTAGGTAYDSDDIYVVTVNRSLFKERLDAGNWVLTLSGTLGTYTFIDDSNQALGVAFGRSGEVFNVVSGSLSGSLGSTLVASGSATFGGYGLFYPSLGVIVLNPAALNQTVGFTSGSLTNSGSQPFRPVTSSVSTPQYNHAGLYNSIRLGANFQARSSENISSTHYFVQLKAGEFNYSNNPSFYDSTDGTLVWTSFIQDPRPYVTTIGLYNDNGELLAVAKTSQPIQKGFDKMVNIKVRLDW